ncbi:MAG: hypothetical protein J6K31_11125 [Parabacteroides sp.]|nr:hypothetical protein [Parabacteroides sp.]
MYIEDDYEDFNPEDDFTQMSNEKDPFETDEDYEDRMQSLYGDDWNA